MFGFISASVEQCTSPKLPFADFSVDFNDFYRPRLPVSRSSSSLTVQPCQVRSLAARSTPVKTVGGSTTKTPSVDLPGLSGPKLSVSNSKQRQLQLLRPSIRQLLTLQLIDDLILFTRLFHLYFGVLHHKISATAPLFTICRQGGPPIHLRWLQWMQRVRFRSLV